MVEIPTKDLVLLQAKLVEAKEVERFDGEETCKGHDSACFGDTKPIKRVYGCDDTPFVSVLSHDWVITRWDDRFFACNSQDLAHYYGHLLLDNAFLLAEEQELPDLPVPLVQATFEGIVVVSVLGVDKSWYSKLQNMKSRTQHKLPRQDTAPLFWEASFTCSVCSHKQLCNVNDQLWILHYDHSNVLFGRVTNQGICDVRRYNVHHPVRGLRFCDEVVYILTVDEAENKTVIHRWSDDKHATPVEIHDFQAHGFAFEEQGDYWSFAVVYDESKCHVVDHDLTIRHTFQTTQGRTIRRAWVGVHEDDDVWVLIETENDLLEFFNKSFGDNKPSTYTMPTPSPYFMDPGVACLFVSFGDTVSNRFEEPPETETFLNFQPMPQQDKSFVCTVYLTNNEMRRYALLRCWGASGAITFRELIQDKAEGITAVVQVKLRCSHTMNVCADKVVLFGTKSGMLCYAIEDRLFELNENMPMAIQGIQTVRVGHVVYILCYNEEHAMLFGINDHGSDIVSFNVLQNDVGDDFLKRLHIVADNDEENKGVCDAPAGHVAHSQHIVVMCWVICIGFNT